MRVRALRLVALTGLLGVAGCRLGADARGLQSADPRQRARAVVAAGERRDAGPVPLLVDRLEDEDPAVRFYAIQALRKITGKDLGYAYYAPADERALAVRRWRAAVRNGTQWAGGVRGWRPSAGAVGPASADGSTSGRPPARGKAPGHARRTCRRWRRRTAHTIEARRSWR